MTRSFGGNTSRAPAGTGRECVKTLWCHFRYVNFGHVRELARNFSNSSRLFEHVRGRQFFFSHGLGQEEPLTLVR